LTGFIPGGPVPPGVSIDNEGQAMSTTREFYIARAEEAAAEAASATLANVRERAQRSSDAWREMADRMERVERQRVVTEQARAERIAAEG